MKKVVWKIFKAIIPISILGVFGCTIYYLYQKDKEKPIVYETTNTEIKNIIKKTIATGAVNPRREIDIKPQIQFM